MNIKIKKFLENHPKLTTCIFAILMAAGVLFLYFNKPGKSNFLPVCLFYKITHLYCAGCGTTRALYSLIHGDLKTAFRCNILTIMILPFGSYSILSYAINAFSGKLLLPPIKFTKSLTILIIILVASFVILRNLPVYPFNLLAPITI